jgi:glutamate dehydrogenase
MSNSHFAELIAYAQAHPHPAADRQGPSSLLTSKIPIRMKSWCVVRPRYAEASAHWRLLDTPRAPGTPRIRVYNPTLAEDGFVSDHTIVQIVNDNMPFLVDSVTMAINRSGRTAHWIVHPC